VNCTFACRKGRKEGKKRIRGRKVPGELHLKNLSAELIRELEMREKKKKQEKEERFFSSIELTRLSEEEGGKGEDGKRRRE